MGIKKNNGITLIALVITIIILLILAGVTIASVLGENGILTRAQNAQKMSDIQSTIEAIRLDILGEQIDVKGKGIKNSVLLDILARHRNSRNG